MGGHLLRAAADVWEVQNRAHDRCARNCSQCLPCWLVAMRALLRVRVEECAAHIAIHLHISEMLAIRALVVFRSCHPAAAEFLYASFVILECVQDIISPAVLDAILDCLVGAKNSIGPLRARTQQCEGYWAAKPRREKGRPDATPQNDGVATAFPPTWIWGFWLPSVRHQSL